MLQDLKTGPVVLEVGMQVNVEYRARASYAIEIIGLVQDKTGKVSARRLCTAATTTTTFARTAGTSSMKADERLYLLSLAVVPGPGGSVPTIARDLFLEIGVYSEGGQRAAILTRGYYHDGNSICWPAVGIDDRRDIPAIYQLSVLITNGGANAGNHVVTITPAAGSRFELLLCTIYNGDAVTRTSIIYTGGAGLLDPGSLGFLLANASIASGARGGWPTFSKGTGYSISNIPHDAPGKPIEFAGAMSLVMQLASLDVLIATHHMVLLRVWGPLPTITTSAPVGAVVATQTSAVVD